MVQEISTINNRMKSMSGQLLQIEQSELELLKNRLAEMKMIHSFIPKYTPKPWGAFRLFRRSSDELTHSYILAYFFDPNLPHGLDDLFLQLFLEQINIDVTGLESHAVEVDTEVRLGKRIMDIILDMGATVVVIENKIYNSESPGQTREIEEEVSKSDRYGDKEVFYVYLSPKGIEPENTEFIPVSYKSIAEIIRNITIAEARKLPQKTYYFLMELLEHIEEEFEMPENKWVISERSRLYLKYQKEIDELIKSYEDDINEIAPSIEEVSREILLEGDWKYNSSKRIQQVYKDRWHNESKNFFIHYETWLNSEFLKERKLYFMVDVEYAQKEFVLSKFDEDASIKEKLNKIGSNYRPKNRTEAIAYKEYKFNEDLSNIKEVLSKAFEEHVFLVDKIDEVVDKL